MPVDFSPIYEETKNGVRRYRAFVDGQWIEAADGGWLRVDNPADGSPVGEVPRLTAEDVERALDAAGASRRKLRDIPAIDRIEILARAGELMEEHRQEFLDMVVAESGKPVDVAKGEVHATIERLHLTLQEARSMHGEYVPGDWVKDTAGKFAIIRREPHGVVAAITPYNYPLFIASAKVVPALVAGNTVVAKPSTEAPICFLMFARVLEEAGLPAGAFNVVTGRGSEIGDLLAASPKVNAIGFTGSTSVGERIAKLAGMKKLALELGGKGAALVCDDANLEVAAKNIAKGGLRFSGQRCDAVDRVLAHTLIADELVARLKAEVEKNYPLGDPRDPKTQIGPLINKRATDFVEGLVQDALDKGATLVTGGHRRGDTYYEPTVLDHVTTDMRIAWEETFGPVIPVIRVASIEEMVELANASEYGLDSSVFTDNLHKAIGISKRLEDGEVTINGYPAHGVGHFPFGGNKKSGMGREGIGASLEEMTRTQTIVFNLPPMDTPYGFEKAKARAPAKAKGEA